MHVCGGGRIESQIAMVLPDHVGGGCVCMHEGVGVGGGRGKGEGEGEGEGRGGEGRGERLYRVTCTKPLAWLSELASGKTPGLVSPPHGKVHPISSPHQ